MTKYLFKKRYAFFLLIAAGVWVMFNVPPVIPILQLAPEALPFAIGDFVLTNTLLATVVMDVILIALGLYLYSANKRMQSTQDKAPRGLHNAFEAVIEFFFNQAEETAGPKWVSAIFPIIMTIILMVLVSNWMELIPGVDSIGILEPSPTGEGFAPKRLFGSIYYLDGKTPQTVEIHEGAAVEHEGICEEACVVLPYLRVPSTSLNFTLSLAIVAVVMTQVMGFRALGLRYLTKFFAFGTLFTEPLGLIDAVVGFLELIGEIARLLSFSFRLLGNIFAGSVLLFVISFLIPPFAPWLIAFLELFVGLIQAYVFGMLTLTFMSGATVHHGPGAEQH